MGVVLFLLVSGLTAAPGSIEVDGKWQRAVEGAGFARSGLERLYHPQYQYACIGLGGTVLRAGPYGFTRPGAPRLMPGGYLQHLPYLTYEYWWDEAAVRHVPFDLTGGYGDTLEPGEVTGFRERLDIATGLLRQEIELRVNEAWEGLYAIGMDTLTSRRELFVTPDGVLVVRVDDTPGTELPFGLRIDVNRFVRVYLNQGIHAKEHAPWSGTAAAREAGLVVIATRPASCTATLAVAVEGAGVQVEADGLLLRGNPASGALTFYIAPGSSYAGPDPGDTAWEKAAAARTRGFAALREETAAWWGAWYGASAVAVPDSDLMRWYARSLYYHGVYFGNTRIPPGCNGTSVESFAGAVCPEYDLVFSQFALLYTGHFDAARGVADWVTGVLPRARRYADEGLTLHETTVQSPGGAKYSTLMGWDGTVLVPPTPGEGVNALSNYPGANAAVMALACVDWTADAAREVKALEVLRETTRVSLAGQQWREDLGGFIDGRMPNVVQQEAALFGLRESLARGVSDAGWEAMTGKVLRPVAELEGREVFVAGFGAAPFAGYGDAPWTIGLWWYGNLGAEDPTARATYDMVKRSNTWKYVFNGGWMGVQASKLGLGDDALAWAKGMVQPGVTLFDDTCFGEIVFGPEDFKKTPEIGAHGALVCNVTHMLLDGDGAAAIEVFPALPASWRGETVAFEGLAARGGIRVSARWTPASVDVRLENSTDRPLVRRLVVSLPDGVAQMTAGRGVPDFGEGQAVFRGLDLPAGQKTVLAFGRLRGDAGGAPRTD